MLTTLEAMNPDAGERRYGLKAANLARLFQAGLPVPPGFVIGPEAEAFEAMERDILESFAALDCARVAVRSSASGEDGRSASFAGMFESSINVTAEGLLDGIRSCLASARAPRVRRYCLLRRVDPDGLRVAVIVQAMVDGPRLSGILFTRDPTGKTGWMVLEAAPGACDAVTLGRASVVRRFLDLRTGECRSSPGPGEGPGPGLIDRPLAADLAGMGRRIEELFGCPQDIEWSLDRNGGLWILQARPVTALGSFQGGTG
ncbi:MAG: hypothetical protein FJY82_09730 [Candidatus Aminicenantes bacterium]|nr:hypothetical protein [Candidatus Aminicenantes bacterium]